MTKIKKVCFPQKFEITLQQNVSNIFIWHDLVAKLPYKDQQKFVKKSQEKPNI